jgi:4-amino-4-deoxy-L-arabinose transferase-like glycosyltransferase
MSWFDRLALGACIAVSAILRFPGIAARGRFDADQGHDMLTLLAFTRDGVVPLLGPKTSVGEFHHGAFYYFLLAPASAISNADPVVVTAFLALLGIGAVALTWWLARELGGSRAGALAGLLLAVSPAAIDESTFIWNPNPIGFFAILAVAAAWRARSTGRSAWWALALAAAGAVVQLHVLGVVFFVAILVLVIGEVRRDHKVLRALVAGLAVVALLFVPLLVHELQTGFSEVQAMLAYVHGGDETIAASPSVALLFTLLRVVGWPFVGLVTDVLPAATIFLAVTLGCAFLAVRLVPAPQQIAIRWLLGVLAWSTVALAFAAPSLQRVVPGLPNDHYHAFLDPIVVLLVAVPLGILLERSIVAARSTRRPISAAAPMAVGLVVVLIVGASIARRPPDIDPDGGWPALQVAGTRLVSEADDGTMYLVGLPAFKLPDAIGFPVVHANGRIVAGSPTKTPTGTPASEAPTRSIVVVCDRLFEGATGAACGGPAEDAWMQQLAQSVGATFDLKDRFDASPRTAVSLYERAFAP